MERHDHIVRAFEGDLSSLNNKIANMGGFAEQVVSQSLEALERRDRVLAHDTIEQDEAIDRLEAEIETDVGIMIIKRQPVAYDLRQVMAPFRVATDLERIGDLGKNIAKRTLAMGKEVPPRQLMLGLKHMGELALGQLKDVLDAFMERDADHALKVWYKDESLDAMYNSVFRELLKSAEVVHSRRALGGRSIGAVQSKRSGRATWSGFHRVRSIGMARCLQWR